MGNPVSSVIFAYRNVGKTERGEIGRAPVAAAQSINVASSIFNKLIKCNKAIAQTADVVIENVEKLSSKSKLVRYPLKCAKWATQNVNPLICASGVLKVAKSDDKTTTAVKEVAALSTMFAGEGIAKKVLPKMLTKLHFTGKTAAVLNGLLFVGASIGSYSIGEHLGDDLAKEVKANLFGSNSKKINCMA